MARKRHELLKLGPGAIILPDSIIAKKPAQGPIEALEWLAYVDFSYIAATAELGDFYELFDFLRKSEKIYCS